MDATQIISDSILESDEEENKEEIENKRGRPLAKLCILKNEHIPETELPLFLGDNVLGRDPNTCTLPLPAPSISKQHATICISVYRKRGRHSEVETEALIWDHGSMNGTRKGHMKLTPNVRYALSEGDGLAVADISCQYVSCTIGRVSSKGDTMASVSQHSGVNDISLDGSGEKGGDTSTGGKTCFNGDTKASVLLSDQEDRGKTSVRTSYLSFEQTPTQPHGTLVPESDSDSDDKKGDGRRKALVSNSDFHESGPACSTFLSPTNKIVPESEDESPITPPSSAKNRPHGLVSFSKEDQGVQQQLKKENILGVVHNNEEEEEEEERAALVGSKSEESEHRVSGKHESNVSLTGENELPKSSATFLTDPIPVFDMDSDTDVEGEEERGASAGPVTLNANQQADHPPNTAHFYIDSDTDVDEQVHKSAPSSVDHTKPLHVISVIQPEGITFDSDTDVDEDDVSEAAIVTASLRSTNAVVSSPSKQRNNLHLDSDTDIEEEEEDEEEENQCRKNSLCSKIDETPTLLDIKSTGPKSAPDSETEDGALPAPAIGELSVVSAGTESVTTADLGGVLGFLSDSDTDVEDDSSLLMPVVASNGSINPGIMSGALQSDSDADRDVDESSMSPAGDGVDPADLRVDSDTDVEDEENQVPSLRRENTPGLLVPLQQNCSTPVQMSGRELEDMETQAFLIPASSPFGHLRPMSLSPGSANPEDDLCVVAETQSFLLPTRDCQGNPSKILSEDPIQSSVSETCKQSTRGESFQLGLSESSHLEGQAQALATESTQAFVSVVQGVNLEDTQAYADTTSLENDSNLQAHGDDQEPATCSEMSAKEGRVDFSLEATQAYIPEPDSDSEVETNEDERIITAAAETQPFFTSSTIALAETQPMFNMEEEEEEEESLSHKNPIPSLLQVKSSSQHVTKEKEEPVEAAQPVTETQPMHVSEDEEIDGEELFLQKANQLRLEDQSQTLTKSESSLAETQPIGQAETLPMATSDVSVDSIPGPRKRKAKQMWLEDVQIQTLANPELSTVETQPVDTCTDSESDEEDSTPGPRKRRAKVLQLEDETEPLTSSAVVETELLATCMSEQRKDEDTTPGLRKRKAKTLPLEEEETQPLTVSEVSAVESQPIVTGEERDSDDEDSIPGPRKRTAKPIQKEDSTEGTKTVTLPPRGKGRQTEAGSSGTTTGEGRKTTTRARLREEEEQAECSEPPKRRRTRAMKALPNPTSTVSRGKARLDEEESVKEEEVEQAKQARGKTFTVDPKDSKQDEETLETGRKNIENNILKKPKGREEQYKKLEMERKDKEEHDRLQAEDAEKLRLEQEGAEKERIERERKEEDEKEIADRTQKEREEHLKQKRNNEEENERHEKAAREEERIEKERAKEEKERLECEKAEREENERTEKIRKEDQEKLQCEKAEREKKEMAEMERKEEEEKERLMTAKREQEERLERERNEQEKEAKEKQTKEQQGNQKEENSPKRTATGQRTTRRTRGAPRTTGPHQDSTTSANDDVPARRTRSRSNSSNSVSSERSVSSVSTQGGSGRGRGAKRQAAIATSSNRRTVAAEPTQRDIHDLSPRGVRSRSNSEISSCSLSSHSRGRGGRQRGRGRKTESDSIPPAGSQSGQNLALEPTTRGRRGRNEVPPEEEKEEADSQPASTIRRRQRANANSPKPTAGDQKSPSSQRCARKDSPLPKSNVLGRGQKAVKSETVEVPPAPAVSDGEEAKEKTKGTKRDSKANAEEDSSWSSKISEVKERAQTIEEAQDKSQVQVVRKGRASSAQTKKKANVSSAELVVKEESEEMEEVTVRRRVRGRPSMVQKLKKEKQEEMDQDPPVEASEPQTRTSSVSRKRPALTDSSPAAKTTRSSSASPAAGGQWRAARQAYKVLFTGVVDEEGERVLARLGGSLAEGVADMNCLVTDKVRRTVKFLCALAKGVPIVTTHWLERSGRAGSFLPPNAFVVKDPEQEKKFSFSLQDSLGIASNQRLLQGYRIHVTKSVKPEPVHMKDIISCSGATFLPKMPSSYKPQTVVISCEEDLRLCGTALSESVPVVTAEFILTGILRQKVDLETHKLSTPVNTPQPAGGRGRSRKKT